MEQVILNEELKKLYNELQRCKDTYVKSCINEDIIILERAIVLIRRKTLLKKTVQID